MQSSNIQGSKIIVPGRAACGPSVLVLWLPGDRNPMLAARHSARPSSPAIFILQPGILTNKFCNLIFSTSSNLHGESENRTRQTQIFLFDQRFFRFPFSDSPGLPWISICTIGDTHKVDLLLQLSIVFIYIVRNNPCENLKIFVLNLSKVKQISRLLIRQRCPPKHFVTSLLTNKNYTMWELFLRTPCYMFSFGEDFFCQDLSGFVWYFNERIFCLNISTVIQSSGMKLRLFLSRCATTAQTPL